jgi:succinyl-CoA synthetase alpha subunit
MRRIPMMRKPGYDRVCGAWQSRFKLKDTPRSARNPLIGFAQGINKQRTARMRLLGSGVSNVAGTSASDDSACDTITTA